MKEAIGSIWVANAITSGIIVGIIAYFFKRYITQQDNIAKTLAENTGILAKTIFDKHQMFEKDVKFLMEKNDKRCSEIENNYLKRFEDIHKEINASNNRLAEKVTIEVRDVTKNINMLEVTHVKEVAEVRTEVKNLYNIISSIKKIN